MRKICVFSDSHGWAEYMLRAVERESPDLVIFLGDGLSDLRAVEKANPFLPVEKVQGNCDLYSMELLTLRTTVAGKRIFAVHGHKYGVKMDPALTRLRYAAMEDDADILLFGHTHIPYLDHGLGMEIMNPGSIGAVSRPTYGVVTIDGDRVSAELRNVFPE